MRYLLFIFLLVGTGLTTQAQLKLAPLDKSPLDVAYYPANFPILKIQDKATEPLVARVLYSRPQRNNRTVFGELVEFNKVWRLGANEATEIDFFKDVNINGKKIKKGRYTLFAIPTPTKWTFLVNTDTDTWGAFKYDAKKTIAQIEVPVNKLEEPVEAFYMAFEKMESGCALIVMWDNLQAKLPIKL